MPALSIILPVFNCEKYLKQAIDSILNQTFEDMELLIADDGSSDSSREIINRYADVDGRVRIVHNEKNRGKVWTANHLLQFCCGEFVTVHDADDYSHPQRFEKQIGFLLANPSFGMCGTQFIEIDGNGTTIRKVVLETDPNKIKEKLRRDSQFHGPTMVLKTELLEAIGGLYRNFKNKEDVDLSMRISEKYQTINLNEYLYYYRLIPEGISKRNFDFMRFEGLTVLHLLAEQRRAHGEDCLMKGDLEVFEKLLLDIRKPYLEDPSLLYRKGISLSVYFRFWGNAFQYALRAMRAAPGKWINYREFLYVVKVWVGALLMRKYD